jgi:hypothetical protein
MRIDKDTAHIISRLSGDEVISVWLYTDRPPSSREQNELESLGCQFRNARCRASLNIVTLRPGSLQALASLGYVERVELLR